MWISAGAALFVLPRLPGAVARTAAVSSVGGTNGSVGASDKVETKSSAERGLKKDFVAGSWRPDLPWDELAGSLEGSLQDTGPSKYIEECVASPIWELPWFFRSAWFLVDQPSGVCLPHLYCGLEYCDPKPNTENEPFINRLFGLSEASSEARTGEVLTYSALDLPVFDLLGTQPVGLPSKVKNWVTNPANPSYDVPPKTIHPRIPSDVVNAVNFARTHGLQVSVKNSGHSYSGSSSKAGTLLLNMRQYMTEMIDITSCDSSEDDRFDPCRLASARGKPGYVRVSGGRNWAEVYQAVNDENAGDPQYLASGGAAATVSPQGWTWQGGLAGSANGRTNGFGADQVLQIEMVTANGWHVRFAPVEWDIVRTEAAPKTTKVEGECFLNDAWTDCPEDFPFKDLWKAMRGGGGGYGVVLSSTIQLNPYRPLQWLRLGNLNGVFGVFTQGQCQNGLTIPSPQASSALQSATLRFKYLSMLDPKKVGLNQAQSDACGTPGFGNIFCYGTYSDGEDGPAEVFLEAWKRYLDDPDVRKPLEDAGIDVDLVKTCNNIDELKDDPTNQALTPYNYEDYAAWLLRNQNTVGPDGTTLLPADGPQPDFTTSTFRTMNVVVPKNYIVANIDEAASLFPSVYSAFGGTGNELADDQCNAVSEAYRGGGDMVLGLFPSEKLIEEFGAASAGLYPLAANDTFYEEYFPRMYDTTDPENFPAFLGTNHYAPDSYGPLKSDWKKACPVEWSRAKRDAECISVQEAVWGTKLLRELEQIKDAVDPDGMFTCNKCVGDNKAKKKNVPASNKKNRLASLNSKVTFKDVPATEARSGAAAKGFSWLSAAVCVVWYGWALQW